MAEVKIIKKIDGFYVTDCTGKTEVYDYVGNAGSGCRPVRKENLWGYIDTSTGLICCDLCLLWADQFINGFAAVKIKETGDNKEIFIIINTAFMQAIPEEFSDACAVKGEIRTVRNKRIEGKVGSYIAKEYGRIVEGKYSSYSVRKI